MKYQRKLILLLTLITQFTTNSTCLIKNCRICNENNPITQCLQCEDEFIRKSKISTDGNSIYHVCQNKEDLLWFRFGVVTAISIVFGFFIWVIFVKCFFKNEKLLILENQRDEFYYKKLIKRRGNNKNVMIKKSRLYTRMRKEKRKKRIKYKIFDEEDKKIRKLKKEKPTLPNLSHKTTKNIENIIRDIIKKETNKKKKEPLPKINIIPPSTDLNNEKIRLSNTSIDQSQFPKFEEIIPKKINSKPNSQNKLPDGRLEKSSPYRDVNEEKISLPNFGNLIMESMNDDEEKPKTQEFDNPLLQFSRNYQTNDILMKSRLNLKSRPQLHKNIEKKEPTRNIINLKRNYSTNPINIIKTPNKEEGAPMSVNFSNSRVFYPKPLKIKKSKPTLVKTTIKYPKINMLNITSPNNELGRSIRSIRTIDVIRKNEENRNEGLKVEKKVIRIFSDKKFWRNNQKNETGGFNEPNTIERRPSRTTFGNLSPRKTPLIFGEENSFKFRPLNIMKFPSDEKENHNELKIDDPSRQDHFLNSNLNIKSNPYYTQLKSTERFKTPDKSEGVSRSRIFGLPYSPDFTPSPLKKTFSNNVLDSPMKSLNLKKEIKIKRSMI